MGMLLPTGQIEAMDTPDGHITFLRSQWRAFASFAWEKYLAQGRGAVVIDLRGATRDESNLSIPTSYVAEQSDSFKRLGGWPNKEIAEAISEYVPELDVIFIFLRLNGEIYHYNVSDDLTPQKAYETMSGVRSPESDVKTSDNH
jgi:hypothetical protein